MPGAPHARRLIHRWLLITWVLLSLSTCPASGASIDLFVSPTGSDTNDGSLSSPFQSLPRVQTEIRKLLSQPQPAPPPSINVFLRGGRYELQDTLEFTPQDTGSSSTSPVTYQAYCSTAVEASLISVQPYPYKTNIVTPPRLLWNGNGDKSLWQGPFDPFLEMGIDRVANKLLTSPLPAQPAIPVMDIGDVCVDKVGGKGHTCYTGVTATCVSGCMTACALHLERKTYSAELYAKFSHLFGKKLVKEEDCVENCSLACRACESVTISGAKRIEPGAITTWSVFQTVTITTGSTTTTASIFQADLTSLLPAGLLDANNPTVFSTLYMDDVQLPRAGYPNCVVAKDISKALTEFDCSYATPQAAAVKNTITYDAATFSSRVAQWTNVPLAEVELVPNVSDSLANLRYKIQSVDVASKRITLGAGGGQLTAQSFTNGVDLSTTALASKARFRVENLLEELDSPGEWYFDPASKSLYVMPLDTQATLTSMASVTLEIPLLRQLVRVSGSRENVFVEPDHASNSLIETDSSVFASNLGFRQITFSGTQLLTSDIYERIPGSSSPFPSWPMARIGAIFMETVRNIIVEYCTFAKIGGNAIVVSGESDSVSIHHNNISYVGSSGIALLARAASARNSFGQTVLGHLLVSRSATVASNQVYHVGRRITHSSAVMVAGPTQTLIQDNLIYAFAPKTGRNYWITNADGSSSTDTWTPGLIRGLDTVITIPQTLATNLATAYTVTLPMNTPGFDVPVIAKLIGAPECPTGTGRIGSLYNEPEPFTLTKCSGCCSLHANSAKIRVAGSSVAWADATSRSVVLRPGESLELQAMSSAFFNSITDVYVGFHVVTPNQILELPTVRAQWQILTRKCQYAERTYLAQCSGPCASSPTAPATARGCGNSNIAIQASQQAGAALVCDPDYEPDVYSLVCAGPFDAMADCDGSGVLTSHLYYDCSMKCFTTTCM